MKRAFTARALKYHPDRQADAEARELAVWRMREVNEAWTTLRNPAARAAYDATLRGEVDQPSLAGSVRLGGGGSGGGGGSAEGGFVFSSRSTHPGGSAWFADEPEVADVEPLDETDEPTSTPTFQRWHLAPLIVGGVVLLVVIVLLVRTNNYDDRPNIVQTRERYGVGACVSVSRDAQNEPQVVEVACNGPRTGKVRLKVEFPRSCPLNTINIVLADKQQSLCLDP